MNIRLVKHIDASLARILTLMLGNTTVSADRCSPHSILCIRPGGIGDAVLLAPALAALKQQFPQAQLTVLAEQRNAEVLPLIPAVDTVRRYGVGRESVAVFGLKATSSL